MGTGVRPEEAFGADWSDVDLEAGVFTIRRAFAKGKLKTYAKTARSRRRVPIRSKVIASLKTLPKRAGIVFLPPVAGTSTSTTGAAASGRPRSQRPVSSTAHLRHASHLCDVESRGGHERLHARPSMGTSVPVIDATYGHLAIDADGNDRELLDAYDEAKGHVVGTDSGEEEESNLPENGETAP